MGQAVGVEETESEGDSRGEGKEARGLGSRQGGRCDDLGNNGTALEDKENSGVALGGEMVWVGGWQETVEGLGGGAVWEVGREGRIRRVWKRGGSWDLKVDGEMCFLRVGEEDGVSIKNHDDDCGGRQLVGKNWRSYWPSY